MDFFKELISDKIIKCQCKANKPLTGVHLQRDEVILHITVIQSTYFHAIVRFGFILFPLKSKYIFVGIV